MGRYFRSLMILSSNKLAYMANSRKITTALPLREIPQLVDYKSISTEETLPSSLRYLLMVENGGKSINSYSSFDEIASLVRKMNLIHVDVDSFETKLLSVLSIPSTHVSKEYIMEWKRSLKTPKITTDTSSFNSFKKLIDCYVTLENIRAHCDISCRLQYIVLCWRLAFVIEDILRNPDLHQKEISLLERLCKQVAKESEIYTLLYFYWTNLLRENSVYCFRKASRILKRYPEMADCLLVDIRKYCDEIDYGQLNTNNLPRAFDVGGLILSSNNLPWSDFINNDITILRLESNMALVFWYADMPSPTFSLLSKVCHAWYLRCHDQTICNGHEQDLTTSLSAIIEDIVGEKCETGHEYLNMLLNEFNKMPLPVFHYIYFAHLDKSNEPSDISRKNLLVKECPDIMKLKGGSFEKALQIGDNSDMKRSYISSFLKEIDQKVQETSIMTTLRDSNNDVVVSKPETKCEPLKNELQIDTLLEEMVQKADYENAINLLAEQTLPSDKSMLLLAQSILETNDTKLLSQIRTIVPLQSKISDKLYLKEHGLRMNEIYSLWQKNQRVDALYNALLRYEVVLEEEYCIKPVSFDSILKNIRLMVRNFSHALLEDGNIEVGHISNLDSLKSFGVRFSDIYQDYSILSIYWETLFFSYKLPHRTVAEDFLVQYPKVPRHIDIDTALTRAMNYNTDDYFPKILRFCLRFDLDNYIKSKVMGQWIIFQCEKGTSEGLRRATELITKAKELQIPLSADALQVYMELENNLTGLNTLILRISSLLMGNKSEKK